MTETATSHIGQIHALLAAKRYSVTELGDNVLRIEDVDSGISMRAVLQGDILYLSLVCLVAPQSAITAPVMHKMLAATTASPRLTFNSTKRATPTSP